MFNLKVLIGCEESQTITKLFRNIGVPAYSCDILPTRGNPDWHYKEDILNIIPIEKWDLIILHPDCTCLAVSGNGTYARGKPGYNKRLYSIGWTLELWDLAKKHSKRVALENPVSVIFKYLPNVQYIQPWQFGHGETKKTGLALHNLPKLKPTNIVDGREPRIHKMGPGIHRKRDRSETYIGIAKAMRSQWLI